MNDKAAVPGLEKLAAAREDAVGLREKTVDMREATVTTREREIRAAKFAEQSGRP